MKSSRTSRFFSSTTTVVYTLQNDQSTPKPHPNITQIPIVSAPDGQPASPSIPITVHLPQSADDSFAAIKIQSAYRSHVVRALVRKISAVNTEANYWERIIQRQDTVDAVRTHERERIKINEALMRLLLRLDSIPGVDPNVRELRRHVTRKIIGLQEILDAVSDTRVEHWDGFLSDWDEIIAGIEKDVCTERGGGKEMERFCAEHLGLQCLQRFLRDQ